MKRFLILCLMLIGSSLNIAQALVTDLSDKKIEIRYSFEGADLILFGAIGHDLFHDDFDVVIMVKGPKNAAKVRRKEKVLGIWMNTDAVTFPTAPGYYAVASTRPLAAIAAESVFGHYGVGFENINLKAESGDVSGDVMMSFKQALFSGKVGNGLYRQGIDEVTIVGEGLFRTDIHLPANVPVGAFAVEAFIIQKGVLKAHNKIAMSVGKEGFERAVYGFANERPFWYGIVAVFIALAAGWVAGMVGVKK